MYFNQYPHVPVFFLSRLTAYYMCLLSELKNGNVNMNPRKELEALGLQPGMVILPPNIVQWICDKFCIDVEP